MGFLERIVGGGDKESSTTSAPWGPQAEQLEYGFDEARRLYGQGYQPASINPNLSSYMRGAPDQFQMGADAAGVLQQYGQGLAGGLDRAQSFYTDAMSNYFNPYASQRYQDIISQSVNANPVLDAQIRMGQQDINRNLQENIMPSIASRSVMTGNTGSSRRGVAEGIAMRGAMEQGSDLATQLQANAYNQGLGQANQWAQGQQFGQNYMMNAANQAANLGQYGLGQLPAAYGLSSQAYGDLMRAGMFERDLEQQQLDAPWTNLQRYYNIIGGNNWGGQQNTVVEGEGAGPRLFNMGMQAAQAAAMGGSDRRLKTNIQKVGETHDGLNVYVWDWNEEGQELFGGQVTKGFMADEVPDHMRYTSLNGYAMVDYSDYQEYLH